LTVRTEGGIDYLITSTGTTTVTIVELNITANTAIATAKFNLPSNRTISADIMYTNTGKLIVPSYTGTNINGGFLTQFDYANNTQDFDKNLNDFGNLSYIAQKSFFVSNNIIYSINLGLISGSVNQWNTNINVTPTFVQSLTSNYAIRGAAQPQQFTNTNFT